MIDEAVQCGLAVNPRTVNQLAWGVQRKGSPFSYVAPDVAGDLHTSLSGAWRILEYVPKKPTNTRNGRSAQSHFGFYIPDAEPRLIPDGALIHESVLKRMAAVPGLQAGQSAGDVTRRCRCRSGRPRGEAARGGSSLIPPRGAIATRGEGGTSARSDRCDGRGCVREFI